MSRVRDGACDLYYDALLRADEIGRVSRITICVRSMRLNRYMSNESPVLYDLSDAVATITLNRPSALNSLTRQARTDLLDFLRRAASDETARAVVITGAGRGFCVGQDLREHAAEFDVGEKGPISTVVEHYNPIAREIARMPKPVIARINGVAAGAGLSIAMLADFRLAAQSASFTTAFAGIGLSCDTGASWSLQRLVGPARARELFFDATPIAAPRALEIGLVNDVVADDELDAAVGTLARRLASGPTLAFAAMREALSYAATHSLDEALDFEEPRMAATGSSQDHRRAVASFLAKEKPTFEGR